MPVFMHSSREKWLRATTPPTKSCAETTFEPLFHKCCYACHRRHGGAFVCVSSIKVQYGSTGHIPTKKYISDSKELWLHIGCAQWSLIRFCLEGVSGGFCDSVICIAIPTVVLLPAWFPMSYRLNEPYKPSTWSYKLGVGPRKGEKKSPIPTHVISSFFDAANNTRAFIVSKGH